MVCVNPGQWPIQPELIPVRKNILTKVKETLRTVDQDTLDVSHKLLYCGNYQNSNLARLSVESYGRWRRVWITKMA